MELIETKASNQKYPTYRDSNLEWLGEIPTHWEVKKLKYSTNIYNGDSLNESIKAKFESINMNDFPYISSKDIDLNNSSIIYENGIRIPSKDIKYKVAQKGSVLICIEGGSAGRKIGFTNQEVCFVNKLACIRSKDVINSKFVYYNLKGDLFQTQFKLSMSGLIGGVAISLINNFYILTPPLQEQTAIAIFLDNKTAKIDLAIAQKEQMITLLKERKQIIIQDLVTGKKVWNSEKNAWTEPAKVKDSGVEWIGEIPGDWEVIPNKVLFVESKAPGNSLLPLLSVSIHSAVSSEELEEEDNIRGKIKILDKSNYKYVDIGYIAFNMMRAWQGAIGAVRVEGMVSPAYVVAKPKKRIDANFFEYQYRTNSFIQQMSRNSKGITDFRKRLYWDEFKQLITIVPTIEVQTNIVNHIESRSTKIDQAIALQQSQIKKLKEYKSILIDSAVTGKIKVS